MDKSTPVQDVENGLPVAEPAAGDMGSHASVDAVEMPEAGEPVPSSDTPRASFPSPRSFLDTPLFEHVHLNVETLLYAVLVIVGVLTRFWELGARAISHDESLHALYSWKLYAGQGYQHSPMMHGPFLFHANALIYALFGDNDFSARIVPALFGVAIIVLPYYLRKWLGRTGALLVALLFTISPSVLYYSRYIRNDIYIAVWAMLLTIALFRYIDERKDKWLYLGATAMMMAILTKEVAYMTGFIGLSFILLAIVLERLNSETRRVVKGVMALAAIVLLIACAVILFAGGGAPEGSTFALLQALVQYLIVAACLLIGAVFASILYNGERQWVWTAVRSISWRAILICILIALILFALLATTFFSNPAGLWTAGGGAIAYWLEQHGVQRGGQPWFYYVALLLPLYEFLPLLFSIIAIAYYLIRGVRDENNGQDRLFVAYLVYWWVLALVLYSWAGEKMPWLVVHPVQPMILLAGRFSGDIITHANWQRIRTQGGIYLAPVLALLAVAALTALGSQPFQGMSIWNLQGTGQWFTAALAFVLLAIVAFNLIRRLGGRASLTVAALTLFVLLGLLSVRFAWLASYINYDYVNEYLVYAHGGPDVKTALAEIDEISRRTVGDREIKVAYDDDSTWPLEWYFRDYKNRTFYGAQPSRESLDAPVVIVGDKNLDKVRPYLGKKYNEYRYRLVWWPTESYKNMSFRSIWDTLTDPLKRAELWDIVFYRKHKSPFNSWPYVHRFYMFVRKDVEAQMWDRGGSQFVSEEQILDLDPYTKGQKEHHATLAWGQPGADAGQFTDPRGIAVDSTGNVYVADAGNHRIQKFDNNGKFLLEFGSVGAAPEQFQEPWGVAVDTSGNIYVADTWNHRVAKFDPAGKLLGQWGAFVDTQGVLSNEQTGRFWGPRAIAFDSKGNVYVSDTGNKRVQVFTPDGEFLRQIGGAGVLEGQFEEPVGLAIDGDDNLYVADTWNQRIQKFDSELAFVKSWEVNGWESQSVVNKPYLAVDDQGHLYVTDPENYRVLVFDSEGNFMETFGQFGIDTASFNLPIGIAVDNDGHIFVVDSVNNRVMKFAPLDGEAVQQQEPM